MAENVNNPVLRLGDLSKSFGGLKAISSLSLEVAPGSISAIIGPNGAGKTTVFNLISGLEKTDGGSIHFRDTRIDVMRSWEIPPLGIARTFQNLRLFSNMTVLENVMMGRYVRSRASLLGCALNLRGPRREERDIREKALQWLDFMGITGLSDRKIREIPFEKQRLVEITRALAGEPALLLLDEPAAGLNITETRNLIDTIYRIRNLGITILVIEHDMDLIMEISERISVLNFGRKIAEGGPAEVRSNRDVIAVYLGKEFA